jgi:hypothetical protein
MKPVIPEPADYHDPSRILERPDGFYWRAKGEAREHGPFATLFEAVQDMQSSDGQAIEPGETVQEAEAEIGIAEWVDPDTGEPAEEERPRLEEH